MRFRLIIFFSLLGSSLLSQTFPGTWYATLDVMGEKLPLVIHLKDSSNSWRGTLDSPKQKAFGIPMNSVEVVGSKLVFTIEKLNVSYQGILTDTAVIVGTFKQGAFKANLNFKQTISALPSQRKIQDPKEPTPYIQEEVSIFNAKDQFNLSGTVTRPETDKQIKVPCVILITGSGAQDRNEEILGHRPFLVLADRLTLAGYSVLRMDDRGTAKSGGTFEGATSLDFTEDIAAAIQFVKTLAYVDTQRIILMGHSEGGMIAHMVAARYPEIYAVISLAGPGVLGSTLLQEQQQLVTKANGASKKERRALQKFSRSFYPILTLDSLVRVRKNAKIFLDNYAQKINEKELRENGVPDRETWVKLNLDAYVNPWMIYFLNYNPKSDLQKLTCHYLALNGSNDLQVPAKMNLDAITLYCNPGSEKIKRIKNMDGLNHLFQPSVSGNPSEYGANEITFDSAAIQEILLFLGDIRR